MLLAAELAQHGIAVTVIERAERTLDVPKAGTLHARTAQSLARRGYLSVPTPLPQQLGNEFAEPFHFAGLPGLTITGPAVEGQPIVGRSQGELERLFEARARRLGADIRRGHTVTAVTASEDEVTLTVEGPEGRSTLVADFAVGTDGARSVVREACGFTSEEHAPRTHALLGLVILDEPYGAPSGWNVTERGWTVIGTNPSGYSRVAAFDFSGAHPDRNRPVTLDELRNAVSRIAGHDIPMRSPAHLDRFSDYARLVHRYRKGRVFLAGDAAHVHFPVGGQGLNLGIQDAMNLGWKLALACRGRGGDGLLDSYHDERRPPAGRVIANTRAQLALMHPDPANDPLRALFQELLQLGEVSRYLGDMISDQDVHYASPPGTSPWTGRFLPNLPLTDADTGTSLSVTGLLAGGRPVLLVLSPDEPTAEKTAAPWRDAVDTVHAAADYPLPWSAVLLRPDGYVAWASEPSTPAGANGTLEAALDRWFGSPDSPEELPLRR
jgi:2-polyprenyl-6-methoxyphenol hydroxylase-like FAD-dependent oxidoreductase